MVTDAPTEGQTGVNMPRMKLDSEFTPEETNRENADTQAKIILSQGLPRHIFNILNQTNTATGKKVICYNCRGEGHVARQCKEPKRAKDSQYFKDKMLLMEAKEKGVTLDAEAEAFLPNVECTAPYDQPLAMTTTNIFEVNHEDAYDSDVDEGPNAAAAFMANLSSTSGTNGVTTSQVNEVHTDANQIFDNVNHLLSRILMTIRFRIISTNLTAKFKMFQLRYLLCHPVKYL
ncbi:integrase, catalytic region, zinc finger, CCHC-type containing protein [Tanacetum coccineum]